MTDHTVTLSKKDIDNPNKPTTDTWVDNVKASDTVTIQMPKGVGLDFKGSIDQFQADEDVKVLEPKDGSISKRAAYDYINGAPPRLSADNMSVTLTIAADARPCKLQFEVRVRNTATGNHHDVDPGVIITV